MELVVAGKPSFNVLRVDVCMIEDLIGGVVLIFRFDEAISLLRNLTVIFMDSFLESVLYQSVIITPPE